LIEIIGDDGTSEAAAARAIAAALEELWPGISQTPAALDDIKIVASAKIAGYRVNDVDVVLCAKLKAGRRFVPTKVLKDLDGAKVIGAPVAVDNLLVAIEVKDHSAANVRVAGDVVTVRYSSSGTVEWKSANQQNNDQVFSLQEYFADQRLSFFVYRLLVMRGLDSIAFNGAVPRQFRGAQLLTAIGSVSGVRKNKGGYTLRSGSNEDIERALSASLFRTYTPTSLDRARMDRIAVRKKDVAGRLDVIGKKMVTFRGRGGAGKTIMLLQTAWQAFEERGLRSIVLTYNHALAADITRLLALLKVPSSDDRGGIAVRTVMSFMFSWFARLGVLTPGEDVTWDQYIPLCESALELFRAGALSPADVQAMKAADPDQFEFDLLIIDEAQDWPTAEVALLKQLYDAKQFCLADGVDQLIRGGRADWSAGVTTDEREIIPLKRSLRMKANLAVFANAVADAANLNWSVVPNDEAAGGRVILIEGAFGSRPELYDELVKAALDAGNSEIDLLFCVPPSDVREVPGGRESQLAETLRGYGADVWDATDEHVRKDFPRDCSTHRIVQYESCRGLEGWTVVADHLDSFWESCCSESMRGAAAEHTPFTTAEQSAADAAWRWCMIALTRPIDTIVISLGHDNECSRKLREIAASRPDIVEVR
jgi:hypothetical protein